MATARKFQTGDKDGKSPDQAARRDPATGHATRQPSRWLRNTLVLGLLVALAVLGWAWNDLSKRALVGSAYAARIGCVCRYVSQRSLDACEGDLAIAPLGRIESMVSLSQDTAQSTVTAGIPLLASQSAKFTPQHGCQLSPWDD